MTSEETRIKLVETVTKTEEAVARLYEAYANSQPEHEEFWFGLVINEADHANLIHSLINHTFKKEAAFFPNTMIANDLEDFQQYLTTEQEKLKQEIPTFTEALQVALNIERSIAKERLYSVFASPSEEAARILNRLRQENEGHIRYLENYLRKYQSKE